MSSHPDPLPADSRTQRPRVLGIPFDGTPGAHNAITDVSGVEVGYATIIEGHGAHAARTGVTAILPRGRRGVGDPATAGIYSMNGNGELTGSHWIDESGMLHLPIGITNSHAVGTVHRGIIDWVVEQHPSVAENWLLPVAAETFDGDLNDINGAHVSASRVREALDAATAGPLAEGNVGGGTGMNCYEFKGGSGTSSRIVGYGHHQFTVGAFVQANFGSRDELAIAGVPIGRALHVPNPFAEESPRPPGGGSVIVVVATDAPMLPGQCKALARRVPLGLARTGTTGSHFSGDIFLAFSTANAGALSTGYSGRPPEGTIECLKSVPWSYLDPFYCAVVECVEEAVVNALFAAETMTGRNGFTSPALPIDSALSLLRQSGRL